MQRRALRAGRHVEAERRRRRHRRAGVVHDVEQVVDVDDFVAGLDDDARLAAEDDLAR